MSIVVTKKGPSKKQKDVIRTAGGSIEIAGMRGLQETLRLMSERSGKSIDKVMLNAAFLTHKNAVLSIQQGPKRKGRHYPRGKKVHIASAPGQPPKTDTGNLVSNITVQKEGFADYSVGSRSNAPYGFWLEFGTSKMLPRPWLMPATKKTLKITLTKLEKMNVR